MSVRVDGLREWRERLARMERTLSTLEDVHARAARLIGAAARPPIRTGRLAGSQSVDTSAGAATLTWTAPHAGFVHYGTRYMAARPFATDAADRIDPQLIALYTEQFDTL